MFEQRFLRLIAAQKQTSESRRIFQGSCSVENNGLVCFCLNHNYINYVLIMFYSGDFIPQDCESYSLNETGESGTDVVDFNWISEQVSQCISSEQLDLSNFLGLWHVNASNWPQISILVCH